MAFECVPENVVDRRNNIRIRAGSRLSIDEGFLAEFSGRGKFNVIDQDKHDNPGAVKLLELDFRTRDEIGPDNNMGSIQRTIGVKATCFDVTKYPTPHTDLIDVQEAELLLIKGFGSEISNVTNVVLDTSLASTYNTGETFWEVYDFLYASGFG